MIWIILCVLIALVIGIFCGSKFSKYKIIEKNYQIEKENNEAIIRNKELIAEYNQLLEDKAGLLEENNQQKTLNLQYKEDIEKYRIDKIQKIDLEISQEFEKQYENLKENLQQKQTEILSTMNQKQEQIQSSFDAKNCELTLTIDSLNKEINELKSIRASAIEIAKHDAELEEKKEFYKLQISEDIKNDIKLISDLTARLHQPETIGKIIYKVYLEKPYTDLIGRVVGKNQITGIYKITNTTNNKVYIGQAVDIAQRWKQHIKRAIGAEPLTQNKLYPAMRDEGVWNFTFEIVEQCTKDRLSQQEQYWQSFFGAKEYGYSIK